MSFPRDCGSFITVGGYLVVKFYEVIWFYVQETAKRYFICIQLRYRHTHFPSFVVLFGQVFPCELIYELISPFFS